MENIFKVFDSNGREVKPGDVIVHANKEYKTSLIVAESGNIELGIIVKDDKVMYGTSIVGTAISCHWEGKALILDRTYIKGTENTKVDKRFVIIYHIESSGRTETTIMIARNEATALIEFNVDNNKYGYYPIAIRELPEPFTSTKDLYL